MDDDRQEWVADWVDERARRELLVGRRAGLHGKWLRSRDPDERRRITKQIVIVNEVLESFDRCMALSNSLVPVRDGVTIQTSQDGPFVATHYPMVGVSGWPVRR